MSIQHTAQDLNQRPLKPELSHITIDQGSRPRQLLKLIE